MINILNSATHLIFILALIAYSVWMTLYLIGKFRLGCTALAHDTKALAWGQELQSIINNVNAQSNTAIKIMVDYGSWHGSAYVLSEDFYHVLKAAGGYTTVDVEKELP